ncbi:hypothetical protein ACWIUA_03930 [Ursidibacter sp. B-7004-1]
METNLKKFKKAVEAFVIAKTDKDLLAIFPLLPDDRQDYRARFDDMFINADNHLFFILTTNLAEWVDEISDDYPEYSDVLYDFWDLFEFVEDEITENEQQEIIKKAKLYLDEFNSST